MKAAFYYLNPGKPGAKWRGTRIHSSNGIEGVMRGNVAGHGGDDILVNHFTASTMTWLEHLDQAPWFREHTLGAEGEGRGNGLGDINGDGRNDIVTPSG